MNSVTTDIQTMATELNSVARAAPGQFTPQIDEFKSALATLKSRLKDLGQGTASVSSVTNAAKNVKTRADNLATATSSACPSATSSPS